VAGHHGLKVECALDERTYAKGVKVTDAEMASLDISSDEFHPEWNSLSGQGGPKRSAYLC